MHDEQLDATAGDDPSPTGEDDEIDFDSDQVDVRPETESDGEIEDGYAEDPTLRIGNVELDNVTDEFVELINARDLDAMNELLSPEVVAEFLDGTTREEVVAGFGDLLIRYPTLLATRADLGSDPVVALWTFDPGADRFDQFGFLLFELDEASEGPVQRISHIDEAPDSEETVLEVPERADLPEWEDWSELDED